MSSVAAMWSPLLFGFALFLNAALLFLVQPLIGRTLLPHLGGNPVAWNACLVFFQATLLAGYVHADLLHRFRGLRWQPWLQLLLLGTATVLCFMGVLGDEPLGEMAARLDELDTSAILTSLALLTATVGLPFFVLSALGPMVQRWFAHLDHPKASDPYFLFVASNLGGLTALVIYSLLVEPYSPLYAQWLSWKLALASLGVLVFLTALCVWLSPRNAELEPAPASADPAAPVVPQLIGRGPATWPRRLLWLTASALPVALMMSVTDYLTLDVAPTPLLWAVPLALYLLAFGQAFGRFAPLSFGGVAFQLALQFLLGACLIIAALIAVATLLATQGPGPGDTDGFAVTLALCFGLLLFTPRSWLGVLQPITVLLVVFVQVNLFAIRGLGLNLAFLHLACFYLSARLCLGMLAEERPAATALTKYFTWIGIGGLCGGLFQLVLAPWLFQRGYLEYSLLAALASTLRPAWSRNGLTDWLLCKALLPIGDPAENTPARRRIARAFDGLFALLLALFTLGLFATFRGDVPAPAPRPVDHAFWHSLASDVPLVVVLIFAAFLYLRPLRFGLGVAAVVCLSFIGADADRDEHVLLRQRTPRGILQVGEEQKPLRSTLKARTFTERTLHHGAIRHGSAITEPPELRRYPTTYYHQLGPVGKLMRSTAWFTPLPADVRPDWLQHHRDHEANDARIAASLVGMGAAPFGGLMDQLVTAWSEPPFAFVGLGAGTLFTYAHPYQWVDAYELDPAVVALSMLPEHRDAGPPAILFGREREHDDAHPLFDLAARAEARGVSGGIVVGDARRNLARPGREGFYHMIFIDAFHSEAIPIHLLTQQAIGTYFQKLSPDGIVCIHTSNRHVDLSRELEKIARDLAIPMRVVRADPRDSDAPMFLPSEWVILTRTQDGMNRWTKRSRFDHVEELRGIFRRDPFNAGPRTRPWSDEQSSVMTAVRPGQGWPTLIYWLLSLILVFGLFLGATEAVTSMLSKKVSGPFSRKGS